MYSAWGTILGAVLAVTGCGCMQVFVLQKALPPISAVLISSLPAKVIVQVPEAVVAVLLVGQALLFGASQMKGLAALLIYNHTAQVDTAQVEQAAEPAAEPA